MATIDWEERTFQLASSLYASNFDEMDAESAIANALHFNFEPHHFYIPRLIVQGISDCRLRIHFVEVTSIDATCK